MFDSLLKGKNSLQEMAVSPTLDVEASSRATRHKSDEAEQKDVTASLDRCQEFCVNPAHAAAYMLDPKHVGQQILSGEQINGAYYVISNLSQHLNLGEGKVLGSQSQIPQPSRDYGRVPGYGAHASTCPHPPGGKGHYGLGHTPDPTSNVSCRPPAFAVQRCRVGEVKICGEDHMDCDSYRL